jgi:hypothetical protein
MGQIVTLSDGKEIDVSLLPLRAYGELIKSLGGVFKQIVNEWDNVGNDQIIEMLPDFIAEHVEDAARIVEIGTRAQVSADELLDKRGLPDFIALFTAIITVNDIEGIVDSVKKATAAFRNRKAKAAAPTNDR